MFRPLLVRPSSGWIPSPRKYKIVLYNHWSQGGTRSRLQKCGTCSSYWYKYMHCYISFSIIGKLVGVVGGSGFLHCLVGWLGVTAVRCYGRVFILRCTRWPLQVYCCGGGVRLWCWYVWTTLNVSTLASLLPHIYKYMHMHTHIRITFKILFFALSYVFYRSLLSLLKTSQLHRRSQTPSSHTSTTNEPLLHNHIPATAAGYILERTHGHNSGPLWHPATWPNNARTPSPLRTLTSLPLTLWRRNFLLNFSTFCI